MFNREKVAELQVEIITLKALLKSRDALIRRASVAFVPSDERQYD